MKVKVYNANRDELFEIDGYLDWVRFRLEVVRERKGGEYWLMNEHGGINELDHMAMCHIDPYKELNSLYRELIGEQMKLAKERFKNKGK